MLEINDKGLVIERLDEIIERMSDKMRSIYGEDININPDTPDGQFIGIWSQELADLNEIIAGVYAFSDPTKAVGNWLDIQAKYVGIQRNRASYSYLNDVTIQTTPNTRIPQGYTVTDENGIEWQTVNSATAVGATMSMQFRSSEYGAFHLAVGKTLTPKTVVLGVRSITTTKESEAGRLQESDESLLMRFLRSYSINNLDDREGLEAALLALPDVRDAKVYENYTGVIDALGVAPHSINAVLVGGNSQEIATTIIRKKSLGCGLQGSQSVVLFYQGLDRVINFDYATRIDITAKIKVVRRSAAYDVDVNEIKREVAGNQFLIAEDVVAGSLYCGASSNNYKIKEITLSAGNVVDGLIIPIGIREYGSISASNVEVIIE